MSTFLELTLQKDLAMIFKCLDLHGADYIYQAREAKGSKESKYIIMNQNKLIYEIIIGKDESSLPLVNMYRVDDLVNNIETISTHLYRNHKTGLLALKRSYTYKNRELKLTDILSEPEVIGSDKNIRNYNKIINLITKKFKNK